MIMTKRVGLLGAWLIATLALGFVGYGAVALVGNQVTDQPTGRVVNLSVTTTLVDVVTVPDTAPTTLLNEEEDLLNSSVIADLENSVTSQPDGENDGPTSTSVAPPTSPPETAAPTTNTPPPSPPTTTPQTTPPATTVPGDGEIVETGPFSFTSAGGVVTVTCVVDKVRFGAASPSGGATVMVVDRGPQKVEVHFAISSQQWETKVECEDGAATAEFD